MQPDAPLRRITIWLAILGYAVVVSGLPLPLAVPAGKRSDSAEKRLAAKDRSRPFPCMDKPCGCATAEQCFTSCCCNTPAETLAWATAHAVEPAVLAALERRVQRAGRHDGLSAAPRKPSCCSTVATEVGESCCATVPSPADDLPDADEMCLEFVSLAAPTADDLPTPADLRSGSADDEDRLPEQPRSKTVNLRAMLACGGIVAEWFAAGVALPPPRIDVAFVTPVLDFCPAGDETAAGLRAAPAAPPPRAA